VRGVERAAAPRQTPKEAEQVRKVVLIADDLGLDEGVNDAIFHAHHEGALDGAALMMGQPGTAAAVTRARRTPTLEIGWHLHLADSRPCTRGRWPWRGSPAAAGVALGLSARMRRLARAELSAQWRAFADTGLRCRFVNAHHHLHVHPFVRECLLEILPSEFDGWVRWGRPCFFGRGLLRWFHLGLHRVLQAPHAERWPGTASTTLWGIDRTFAMDADDIARVLPSLGDGLHEFMFHPRRASDADTRCLLELRARLPGSTRRRAKGAGSRA
jgi:hypothetical protein